MSDYDVLLKGRGMPDNPIVVTEYNGSKTTISEDIWRSIVSYVQRLHEFVCDANGITVEIIWGAAMGCGAYHQTPKRYNSIHYGAPRIRYDWANGYREYDSVVWVWPQPENPTGLESAYRTVLHELAHIIVGNCRARGQTPHGSKFQHTLLNLRNEIDFQWTLDQFVRKEM